MIRNFRLATKDFLTRKFIALALLPLVISVVVLGIAVAYGGDNVYDMLALKASGWDFKFLGEKTDSIIDQIFSFSIIQWIISALIYAMGAFLALFLAVFIALIVTGFLTPVIVKEINARHYQIAQISEITTARSLKLMSGVLLKFILIFIATLPFLFVPILNLFVIHVPLFYLYYALLFIDVGSNALSQKRFEFFWLSGGGYEFKFSAFIFYLLCLIPFVGLFLQILFVIYFAHFFLQKERAGLI